MRAVYTFIFTMLTIAAIAQPKIKFEVTEYDFGQFETRGTIKKEFTITNIGNEPLIITRARTGDGGSYATYPREPILPNEKGIITFVYNSKRIGRFQKRIMVQSNASNSHASIKVKGEVIRHRTQIALSVDTIDIGEIPFGMIDTATFEVKNIGQERLFLYPVTHFNYDTYFQNIKHKTPPNKEELYLNRSSYSPNTSAIVTVGFRNIYGNTGDFKRMIALRYNTYDTTYIIIKGRYIGKPIQEIIYETQSIYEYKNGQLQTQTMIDFSGRTQRINYFEGSYLIKSIQYPFYLNKKTIEQYFDKGKLVKEVLYEEKN